MTTVVYMNKQKRGSRICGYIVKSPEEIWNEAQVIIVTSYSVYKELSPIEEAKKIELVNIEDVVGKD